ncbi:MAG TPA: hypothetical protein VF054_05800 [Micromonosporaceae bacterium]
MRTLIDRAKAMREARDRGATATEYAIIIAIIGLALLIGAAYLAPRIQDRFTCTADSVSSGTNSC